MKATLTATPPRSASTSTAATPSAPPGARAGNSSGPVPGSTASTAVSSATTPPQFYSPPPSFTSSSSPPTDSPSRGFHGSHAPLHSSPGSYSPYSPYARHAPHGPPQGYFYQSQPRSTYSHPSDASPRSCTHTSWDNPEKLIQQHSGRPFNPSDSTPRSASLSTYDSYSNYSHNVPRSQDTASARPLLRTPPHAPHDPGYDAPSSISTNMPEYSYPDTSIQKSHPDMHSHQKHSHHPRDYMDHHHHAQQLLQQQHHRPQPPQSQQQQQQLQHRQHDHRTHSSAKDYSEQDRQPAGNFVLRRAGERPMHIADHQRIPPRIHTQWSTDECPPLLQSATSLQSSQSRQNSDNRMLSPSTPGSFQIPPASILRTSSRDKFPMTESPLDFEETNGHGYNGYFFSQRGHHIGDGPTKLGRLHGHGHEYGNHGDRHEDEEEDDDEEGDDGHLGAAKKRRVQSFGSPQSIPSSNATRESVAGLEQSPGEGQDRGDDEDEGGLQSPISSSSSRKQSTTGSIQSEDRLSGPRHHSRTKVASLSSLKRLPRAPSQGDSADQPDYVLVAQEENGLPQSGLRYYAKQVSDRVEAKGTTNYNDLVNELSGSTSNEIPGQENIRRRVYDALNVLESLGIIENTQKDIHWIGVAKSKIIQAICRRHAAATMGRDRIPDAEGDDDSEEPEDDEMDIEKLQKEVDALRLRNELEQAQLQDQVTRHVQVLNLVKRNRRREAKEQEREERRRQRKEEKRARAMAAATSDNSASMTEDVPQSDDVCAKKASSERRRRHRRRTSPRPQVEGSEGASGGQNVDEDMDEDDEEARRRRKEERRERRERKEKKRAQRKQEKEAMLIKMPFVVARMPGSVGQSSDSEASISVVRRVREEHKPRKSQPADIYNNWHFEATGDEKTAVEIQIPYHDELTIVSDTEILGNLGLNTLKLNALRSMLSKELMDIVKYHVNSEESQRRRSRQPSDLSSRQHRQSKSRSPVPHPESEDQEPGMGMEDDQSSEDPSSTTETRSVTVRGGFERGVMRAGSEGVVAAGN